jgi:hypothetical protein
MRIQIATATRSPLFVVAAIGRETQAVGTGHADRSSPITGTFTDQADGLGVFSGTFTVTRFAVETSTVVSIGTLVGLLTDSNGNPIGGIDQGARLPVTDITSICDVLRLEVGPAEVDMLGMRVMLRKDVLCISAHDGSPQTLGPLLRSSARLLESHPTPAIAAAVLNEILRTIVAPQ